MLLRKTLLSQTIQRALGIKPTSMYLALGLIASPTLAENQQQWQCSPSSSGSDWQCQQHLAEGVSYTRSTRNTFKNTAPAATKPRSLNAAETDWVKKNQLTPEQQALCNIGCDGTYIEPVRTDAEAELPMAEAPLRASADHSEMTDGTVAVLTGDVILTQGSMQLAADKAMLDQNTSLANIEGNIRIRQPGLLITGNSAAFNIDTGTAHVEDASYLLHEAHLRGDASQLIHHNDHTVMMEDGSFTRCEPDSNHWHISGSDITINPNENMGTARHIRLNVKDIPVFYAPYIRFPINDERTTGLLFPSVSSSGSNGFEFSQPLYLNLAPNYDLTLAPRLMTERGVMLEAEGRHLSHTYNSELSLAYLPDDKGGHVDDASARMASGETEAEIYPYRNADRWLAGFQQSGNLAPGLTSKINFTRVSDTDYFRDLSSASLSVNSQTHLKQQGEINYTTGPWHASFNAETHQTIAENTTTPYQQLPRININGLYRYDNDAVVQLNHEYVNFSHREKFENNDSSDPRIIGSRSRFEYSAMLDKNWTWGFIKPGVEVKSLHYQLDKKRLTADANSTPSITVPQASLDAGLYFERNGSLFKNAYLQTFEPRLFYFYSDYENHDELFGLTQGDRYINFDSSELTFSYNQLFRGERFSGGDRIGDDNRLSVGLTTRVIDPNTGVENFSVSLGQIYYYDDRLVDLTLPSDSSNTDSNIRDSSQIASQLSANLNDNWRFNASAIVDTNDSDRVDLGSASLRYMDDSYRLINMSYRFTRKSDDNHVNQADASFALPLWGNWSVLGRYNYDFTYKRELETIAGVEYNSCCYRFRAVWREWVDNYTSGDDLSNLGNDRGVFLEFQLKGLGSLGSQSANFLAESIYGFSKREDYYR